MSGTHKHPLIEAAAELKASAYECAEKYRDTNVHTHPKMRRKTGHQILSQHIPSFDKHGHSYLPDDPLTEPVHKPRCNFATWKAKFLAWGVDTARFSKAVEGYLAELSRADLSILPNLDIATERVQASLRGNNEGLSIQNITDCTAFGAFLERVLYEEGFRSMQPRERFKDLAAFAAVLDHAAHGDKKSAVMGSKEDVARASLLLSVFGSYYAFQCGHRSELVRYLRRMDNASDRAGSPFGKYRIALAHFHVYSDYPSLREVIERDLAGQSSFIGYSNMSGGNMVNALQYAFQVNMPLDGDVPLYGGKISAQHEKMCFDRRDQETIFGVFTHSLHARHLAKNGRFKAAEKILADFPRHWKIYNPNLPLSDFQRIAVYRAYGFVYTEMYKHYKERHFLEAAHNNYTRAKNLSERSNISKDQTELETVCAELDTALSI